MPWTDSENQRWCVTCDKDLSVAIRLKTKPYQLPVNTLAKGKLQVDVSELEGSNGNLWNFKAVEKLDSPSIVKAPNGDLVVYMKKDGDLSKSRGKSGMLFRSKDGGDSWVRLADISATYGPTLFTLKDKLCMLAGVDTKLVLRVSEDNGDSWTEHVIKNIGHGLESGGGAPVLFADGVLYYSFMDYGGPRGWPNSFRLYVASCPVESDITDPANWIITAPRPFPKEPAVSGTRNGWLEPNVLKAPDGDIWLIARVDHIAKGNTGAYLRLSSDRKQIEFDNVYPAPENRTGFITAPWAAPAKFHIVYDEKSGKYWMLANPYCGPPAKNRWHPYVRNVLALYSSTDMWNFVLVDRLLEDDQFSDWGQSNLRTGFQQPSFIISGNDLLYVSRTAYGTFNNYHDANMITFHKVADYQRMPYLKPDNIMR